MSHPNNTALKCMIDKEPCTPSALIRRAEDYSSSFANNWYKSTSEAASILREQGHLVEENPDYQQ